MLPHHSLSYSSLIAERFISVHGRNHEANVLQMDDKITCLSYDCYSEVKYTKQKINQKVINALPELKGQNSIIFSHYFCHEHQRKIKLNVPCILKLPLHQKFNGWSC